VSGIFNTRIVVAPKYFIYASAEKVLRIWQFDNWFIISIGQLLDSQFIDRLRFQ